MTEISIGPLKIPALKILAGFLLTLKLPWPLDIQIKVPPVDITFWNEITLLPKITVFNTDWIFKALTENMAWFSDAVGSVLSGLSEQILGIVKAGFAALFDSWARDFYERREEEKE